MSREDRLYEALEDAAYNIEQAIQDSDWPRIEALLEHLHNTLMEEDPEDDDGREGDDARP